MARFQPVFRRDGQDDQSEYRFNDSDGHPEINGRPIVDGETYIIRGVEWLVQREDSGDFQHPSKRHPQPPALHLHAGR